MNRYMHLVGVGVGSCVLASAVAHAQVTKVVAEPAMTVLNSPVKVKVTVGRIQCREIAINFDDGQGIQHYPNPQIPFEVSRSWPDNDSDKLPNIKVIKVKGLGCGGEVQTTVTVLEELKLVPRPKIKTYLGLAKPGGVALILGGAFGTTSHTAQARLKDWEGVAKVIDLKIIADEITGVPVWTPTWIGVEWPSDLVGYPSQDASIWVTRPDGKSSSKYSVQFTPTLELKMLPQSDVKVASCSNDANANKCNQADPGDDACVESLPFFGQSDSSISGYHYNCWGVVGDDSGIDVYQITLANEWALEELTFHKFVEAGEGWVKSPASTFSAGASQWTAKVEWSVTPNDELRYEGVVFIRGPKGVPHK